jgi:WD40 repeat protein
LRLNDENELTDLYCKFKRGCYRGFSTITFHPSEPVVITGSDDGDHLIKIWRLNEDYTRTECIETLQLEIDTIGTNHYRILQIIFHPKSEIMATIGNKIIKIWKLNFGENSECLSTKITDDETIENCVFHPTKPIILVKCYSGDHSRGIPYKHFIKIFSISPIGELTNIGIIHGKFSEIKFNNDGNCLIVDEDYEKIIKSHYERDKKTIIVSTSFYDFSKIMPIVVEEPKVVKEEAKKAHPPDYLIDSAFSCEIMEDPVVACDGITYNRSEIEEWFKKHDTSPKTGEILKSKGLIPNISIRNAIEEWKKSNSQ